jgi:CDP-paratose 2-epimerase
MFEFYQSPRRGEVYNLGGGKQNSCSILEAFAMAQHCSGKKQYHTYVDQARAGDHICYYSDLRKMQSHYPKWKITRRLPQIVGEIVSAWRERLVTT